MTYVIYVYIGCKTLNSLLQYIKTYNHSATQLVQKYIDEEFYIRFRMEEEQVGSSKWCLLEMKRLTLLSECKEEIKEFGNNIHLSPLHCPTCKLSLYYDSVNADNVCQTCGYTIRDTSQEHFTFNDFTNYNKNSAHHYSFKEHFSQTLVDFTNIGNRVVPSNVMNICRVALGTGLHVSSSSVFNVLQQHKLCKYYQYKYEIANRLRGKREIVISSSEIQLLRDSFNRLDNEFLYFQDMEQIGTCSKRGKRRMFWPLRFILSRLCEEIGREDLTAFIRPIVCKERFKKYMFYWDKFMIYVNKKYPKIKKSCITYIQNRLI